MSRRTTSLAVASLAAASFITLGSASASAKDHTDWALEYVDRATVDVWGSDPCTIDWTAMTGKVKAACFFTLTLAKSKGYTDQDFLAMWGMRSPTSNFYFDLVNASPPVGAAPPELETYFRRINRAIDIQKGDIFAVGAVIDPGPDPDSEEDDVVVYAGHTMMITGAPTVINPQVNPRYSGTTQYAVPIVDSTNSSHGCNAAYPDSRWTGTCNDGRMTAGAGTGTIRVYADALTNVLLGYTWSVTSSTTSYYAPSKRPYRIGRLFKLPAPLPTEPPPPPP
jgi:hypothetical protein